MTNLRLEALAEAIAHYSGYQEPGSALYLARNPGGLKAYSPLHKRDTQGNRVFASILDGFQALIYDLRVKLSGKARTNLKPISTLMDLAAARGENPLTAEAWAKFLRKALDDETISRRTTLAYFSE